MPTEKSELEPKHKQKRDKTEKKIRVIFADLYCDKTQSSRKKRLTLIDFEMENDISKEAHDKTFHADWVKMKQQMNDNNRKFER